MRRPPRQVGLRLFSARMIVSSLAQGAIMLVAVLVLYAWALSAGIAEPQARAMAFAGVVLANLALILFNRSRGDTLRNAVRTPNPALAWILGATLCGLALVLYVEPLREIFRFGALTALQVLLAAAAALLGLACLEASRLLGRRFAAPR